RDASAVDRVDKAGVGRDDHLVTERAYGIEGDAAHQPVEARGARHEQAGVWDTGVGDVLDVVVGGDVDIAIGEAPQPDRAGDVMFLPVAGHQGHRSAEGCDAVACEIR